MTEEKKNEKCVSAAEMTMRLRSSITKVATLPKRVYKGTDAFKIKESSSKEENEKQ